jgi:hypothetical protein
VRVIAQEVAALLDLQHGLVSLAQLRALGVTRAQRRWQLNRGWRYVLPSVMFTRPGPLNDPQRLVAGILHGGQGSMISSLTAARWHGVTAAVDRRVHVSVPVPRHPRSEGFVKVHRTHHPDQHAWHRGPVTLVSRARAVIEAARDAPSATALAIVCEATERQLVAVPALRHELEAGPSSGAARARAALAAAEADVWSVPEADLAVLVAGSPLLPPMWANPRLEAPSGVRLPIPDGWFDDVALAVQVHSRLYHSSMTAWDATVTRDGIFAEHGIPVLAVTPTAIRDAPTETVRRIERAHAQAATRPRPAVLARLVAVT